MQQITKVTIVPTTNLSLEPFDNTKLVAINTCPTWGLITYDQHKHVYDGRAMPLEAGIVAHEFFAAHALYYLYNEHSKQEMLVEKHGHKLFGVERYESMLNATNENDDFRTQLMQFCIAAIETTDFVDSELDKKRTLSNIEEMCIAYADHYDFSNCLPAIVDGRVCIEIPFDVTITFTLDNDTEEQYRFIGKIDGINYADETRTTLRIRENKTASKLGEAWESSIEMSNQITGYQIAASCIFNIPIFQTIIYGTCLPLPRNIALNGLVRLVVTKEEYLYEDWFRWFYDTVQVWKQYNETPTKAPKYTHSCGRYFRSCSLIPFCSTSVDDREIMLNEMHYSRWSPLDE